MADLLTLRRVADAIDDALITCGFAVAVVPPVGAGIPYKLTVTKPGHGLVTILVVAGDVDTTY